MRDPDGSIEFHGQTVIRRINPTATAKPFLQSKAAQLLVETGKLVSYTFTDSNVVESPRLPFVSYPFEWCDEQLYLAAQLTLDISREILESGYELKDASAWNVIFQGNKPIFCDHLSFQPIVTSQWWAFGQFSRHFSIPLAISHLRGLKPHQSYSIYRDGIPPNTARNLLGVKRYLSRYWPLMVENKSQSQASSQEPKNGSKNLHDGLYNFCQSMIDGGKSKPTDSHWAEYRDTRHHYTDESSAEKFNKVKEWLVNTKPLNVVDLGCNTGEFTVMASELGADVIAVDLDHDSIQKLVLSKKNAINIHPIVSNLGDMVGGRGWCGDEFPSLMTRLHQHADMLLMLALIHHLSISEGIRLEKIAQMAANITREYLIIELLDESDPMVLHLCSQRKRDSKEFSIAAQQAAFAPFFTTIVSYSIPNTLRKLCLLKRI